MCDMSESLEIVEITDTSINPEALAELDDKSATLEITTNTKRRLSETELDERSSKKLCSDIDDKVATETIENESVIDETIVNESKAADDGENEFNEPDILEQNILIDKQADDDLLVEEFPLKVQDISIVSEDLVEEEDDAAEEEEEDNEEETMAEESFDYHESESEHSSDEDDDTMMARAMEASAKRAMAERQALSGKQAFAKPVQQIDDEPIALDDSDDEEPQETSKYQSDNEQSSEYSVDNHVIGESEEEEDEYSSVRSKAINPKVLLAKRLVKKSFRFLTLRRDEIKRLKVVRTATKKVNHGNKIRKVVEIKNDTAQPAKVETVVELKNGAPETIEVSATINESKKNCNLESLAMDVSEERIEPAAVPLKSPLQEVPTLPEEKELSNNIEDSKNNLELNSVKKIAPIANEVINEEPNDKMSEKPSGENSNESSRHDSSLLTEITNSNMEEIFNRYVVKNTEQSPTLDEFSEELFYCLQQNNQEIEKAKQLWNERLHVKYKIRELMETIRRHRAVMEIENFGYKPENAGNNSRPVISSKSSTTTNSETDHYEKNFRMSSDSVTRLIQDVRATMLKRDEKQRTDELSGVTNAGDNSLASQWNSLQSNSAQGRQGQIIDVQSIINDFRQKNPQEIPRRGRRMKSSFGNNFFDSQQQNDVDGRGNRSDYLSNVTNNSHEFNSTMKSNQSQPGYPEVSLHPVQNLYKNLANSSAASASGAAHFSGQKSSLLQSILTKQSTKTPTGFHQNHALPSTSTLARLLTAPERSFQGPAKHTSQPPPRQSSNKVHNNGEITITPIGLNNPRSKDYAMEDDENSMEPPLVIDETEDFETSGPVKNVSDLLCQGCKKNKAFFMCAGCSRQWYCSKDCQEMAWDEHAESCMI